jgi:hypothetical protein
MAELDMCGDDVKILQRTEKFKWISANEETSFDGFVQATRINKEVANWLRIIVIYLF